VKVTTTLEDGSKIFDAEQFFGEWVLLGNHAHRERAMAMERVTVMSWSAAEVEAQIERQPTLGLALMQILAGRCVDLEERLQIRFR
jgi:CRP-like cAMP-binding protein